MGKAITEIGTYAGPISATTKIPVSDSDTLEAATAEQLVDYNTAATHAATSKVTPVDADEMPLVDSAASNILKKLTWANLKATLLAYFDTAYLKLTGGTVTGNIQATQIGVLSGHYIYSSGGAANYFAGRDVMRLTYSSVEVMNAYLSLYDGSYRVALQADSSNHTLAQRNGTNAQTYRTYGTYTDASNYRRVSLGMTTAGVATLTPEGAGTGASGNTLMPVTGSVTVANLPAASSALTGARLFVSDATATTFLSTVAGGGSNKVPVVCDGTNWLIG